ncbi:Protein ECERIFERUM 26-like [Hirschfeldia incana]|nr:Protein ECERIFERUM 26-like [Hirschfeldia incana]
MSRLQEEGSSPVHGFLLSTVSSTRPTETSTTHERTGLDLAMKLHYVKAVCIYSAETARELTVRHVKGPFFPVFNQIPWITGRLSRHDSGRPFIKCNDCGTRFVESHCDLTVEEWLRVPDRSIDESLVYHQPVGPELAYSPLIYIQMTRFKCGGLAVGFSWAHIIGDPLSVSHFFILWARALAGEEIYCPETPELERDFPKPSPTGKEPSSIKRVDPVGDLWVAPSDSKMTTHSFNVTVKNIKTNFLANGDEFEILSGIIWKCIAKARGGPEPVTITIIRSDPKGLKPRVVKNSQMISSVQVDFSVAEAKLEETVKAIREATDERSDIDKIGESDDFIVYGANLTFVDLSEVDFYEAKIKEMSPKSVYCNVQGIGDNGVVVVLPAAEEEERVVTVTLPEDEMEKVKWELKMCGLIKTFISGE